MVPKSNKKHGTVPTKNYGMSEKERIFFQLFICVQFDFLLLDFKEDDVIVSSSRVAVDFSVRKLTWLVSSDPVHPGYVCCI